MGLGSLSAHDDLTGVTWTMSPSGRSGWVNVTARAPTLGALETCVRALMGEYREWTMIGRPIRSQFPVREQGWVCAMQIRIDSGIGRQMREYDE